MNWTLPALLGAYHGLNPAMGWLFAVSLGLQRRRASGVLGALPAIALGHAASVTLAIGAVAGLGVLLPAAVLRLGGAAVLFLFAIAVLFRRRLHPRWVGMHLGFRELTLWSFLMSSAHGAGLMLIPVLLRGQTAHPAGHDHGRAVVEGGVVALLAHTGGMFLVMSLIALLVYRLLGVGFLRRAWINFDAFWIAALFVAALSTAFIR